MKLLDIKNGIGPEWAEKGYQLPRFDIQAVREKTHAEPTWVHFGAGNLFRAFPAAILQQALDSGKCRGHRRRLPVRLRYGGPRRVSVCGKNHPDVEFPDGDGGF